MTQLDRSFRIGIVDDLAEKREKFAAFIGNKVRRTLSSGDTRTFIARRVNEEVQKEVDRIIAERTKRALDEFRAVSPLIGPPVSKIINAVSVATGYTGPELLGPRRSKNLARARQVACYLMRVLRADLSLPAIGRVMSRDHTTIMHAIAVVERERAVGAVAGWLAHPAIVSLSGAASPQSSAPDAPPVTTPPAGGAT